MSVIPASLFLMHCDEITAEPPLSPVRQRVLAPSDPCPAMLRVPELRLATVSRESQLPY